MNWHEIFEYKDGVLFWKDARGKKMKAGSRAGCINNIGYRRVKVCKKDFFEHRIIFEMFNGYCPNIIDHVNGVRDDNRIENLREATYRLNAVNQHRPPKGNTSGFLGVYWHKGAEKWIARVGKKYLGCYDCLGVAIRVQNEARKNLINELVK